MYKIYTFGAEKEISLPAMHAKNKNMHRDYERLREVIQSCFNEAHVDQAMEMVRLFNKKYKDATYYESLKNLCDAQTNNFKQINPAA